MSQPSDTGKRQQANEFLEQGLAFAQQGQIEAALPKFLEAVKVDPVYAEAHNNIGLCYRELMQKDQSIAAFSRALEIAPTFAQARYNRAATYDWMGLVSEAIGDYKTLQQQGGDKKLQVEVDVEQSLVLLNARLRVGDEASREFMGLAYAKTSSGNQHIETTIASLGSAVGLAILRQCVKDMKIDLSDLIRNKPGQPVFVTKVEEYWTELGEIFAAYCAKQRINPKTGWNDPIAADHKPAQTPTQMAHNTEPTLIAVADKYKVKQEDRYLLATFAALEMLKLAAQSLAHPGGSIPGLHPEVSKALIMSSIIAASKSVPFD